jgi:hypothetical protein
MVLSRMARRAAPLLAVALGVITVALDLPRAPGA